MGDLSIRVLNDDEEPLENVPVAIEFTSLFRGIVRESTDREGYTYFSGYEEGYIIYVDHKNYGEYYYRNSESINITK